MVTNRRTEEQLQQRWWRTDERNNNNSHKGYRQTNGRTSITTSVTVTPLRWRYRLSFIGGRLSLIVSRLACVVCRLLFIVFRCFVCRLSFIICRLSFVVCHLSFRLFVSLAVDVCPFVCFYCDCGSCCFVRLSATTLFIFPVEGSKKWSSPAMSHHFFKWWSEKSSVRLSAILVIVDISTFFNSGLTKCSSSPHFLNGGLKKVPFVCLQPSLALIVFTCCNGGLKKTLIITNVAPLFSMVVWKKHVVLKIRSLISESVREKFRSSVGNRRYRW